MSVTFFEKTANGVEIEFLRETADGWGGVSYINFIRNFIKEYSGNITNKVVYLEKINSNSGGDTVRKIITEQLNPKGNSGYIPHTFLKQKPVKNNKASLDYDAKEIQDLYKKAAAIAADNEVYFTMNSFTPTSNSTGRVKRNLFEDIQDDEVVVNIEELADLFAKEVLEVQGLRYENSLERYKFLVSKYSNFIKEVRKHES